MSFLKTGWNTLTMRTNNLGTEHVKFTHTTTVKPLYFEAHLIRIPVLFELIVHFIMVLNS